MGDALEASARAYDFVGRFGGDEFVVVLPETGARAAVATAERLRANARAALADASLVPIEMSIGVAEWDGEGTSSELLDAADDALRDAKRAGGARVVADRSAAAPDGLVELTEVLNRNRRGFGASGNNDGVRAEAEASDSPG